MNNVRQRRYRGYCLPEAPLRRAVERFVERRDAIEAAVRSVPASERDIRRIIGYLDDFYRAAGKPDRLLKGFERRCL